MSDAVTTITRGKSKAAVLPRKAAEFVKLVQDGTEPETAAKATGLSRRELASATVKAAVEELAAFTQPDAETASKLLRAFLWKKVFTSEDERTQLAAAAQLAKDPALGFVAGGPTVEVNVLSDGIRAMPVDDTELFAKKPIDIKAESE